MNGRLSQSEICFLVTMANLIIDIEKIKEKRIPEEEKEALDNLIDAFYKYRDKIQLRWDQKSKERVFSKIRNYHPMLVPNAECSKKRVSILLDDFYCLSEHVLEATCKGCNGKNGKCDIEEALSRNFVPEFIELDDEHPCHYMYEDIRYDSQKA